MSKRRLFGLPPDQKNMLGAVATSLVAVGAIGLQLFSVAARLQQPRSEAAALIAVGLGLIALFWTLIANIITSESVRSAKVLVGPAIFLVLQIAALIMSVVYHLRNM